MLQEVISIDICCASVTASCPPRQPCRNFLRLAMKQAERDAGSAAYLLWIRLMFYAIECCMNLRQETAENVFWAGLVRSGTAE